MTEDMLARQRRRLMGRAEVLGADVASVCGMQLRVEEVVHACLNEGCKLVETESSSWQLRACSR